MIEFTTLLPPPSILHVAREIGRGRESRVSQIISLECISYHIWFPTPVSRGTVCVCGVVPAECRGYRGELSMRTGWRWTVSSGVVLIEGLNEGSKSSYILTEASEVRVVMRNCRDSWGGYFHHLVSHVG